MSAGLAQKVARFCQEKRLLTAHDQLVVAVSGGPDSLCLLHVLVTLRTEFKIDLTIAHLNHHLRQGEAQADENFVRNIANRWALPVYTETQAVAKLAAERKQSVEEAARQIRYAFLWRVASTTGANKIAVGHNADDQVETVLMHFLRGTGLAGLRGMLPAVNIARLRLHPDDLSGEGIADAPQLIRPLLEISRPEIETYCEQHDLSPRRDDSNQDVTFFRNRLRHHLLPHLETYNPNIRQVIQRTAKVVAADVEFLQDQVANSWQSVVIEESSERVEIERAGWLELPLSLKRSILRRAMQRVRPSLRDIGFEHVETGITAIKKGETGTKATLPQGLMLTVGYHSFVIAPEEVSPYRPQGDKPHLRSNQIVALHLPGVTPIAGTGWHLKATFLIQPDIADHSLFQTGSWEAYLDADVVGQLPILRTRQSGDVFYPLGLRGHRKKVSDFMINEKIPADQRDHIPLLVANEQVLWICGYRPDARAGVRSTTKRILHLKFEPQKDRGKK